MNQVNLLGMPITTLATVVRFIGGINYLFTTASP
jgi:hypothetical protein